MWLQGFFGGDCWTRTSDLLRVKYGQRNFTTFLRGFRGVLIMFHGKQ
nr:MAG TPA: hypothetical protein [Caudoviricetes sp.]